MPLQNMQMAAGQLGSRLPGVIWGLTPEEPASTNLNALYSGGYVNVESSTSGKTVDEYVIQPSTKLYTASKDTYAYINGSDGVLTYVEKTLNATKPTQASIGLKSELLWKAVTDGSDVTGFTDLRRWAPAGHLYTLQCDMDFITANQGSIYIPCATAGRILYVQSSVTIPLSASDSGTATLAIGLMDVYTAVTNGVITAAASSAIGVRDQVTPSAANRFGPGQRIRVTGAKSTTLGELHLDIICEQTAA